MKKLILLLIFTIVSSMMFSQVILREDTLARDASTGDPIILGQFFFAESYAHISETTVTTTPIARIVLPEANDHVLWEGAVSIGFLETDYPTEYQAVFVPLRDNYRQMVIDTLVTMDINWEGMSGYTFPE